MCMPPSRPASTVRSQRRYPCLSNAAVVGAPPDSLLVDVPAPSAGVHRTCTGPSGARSQSATDFAPAVGIAAGCRDGPRHPRAAFSTVPITPARSRLPQLLLVRLHFAVDAAAPRPCPVHRSRSPPGGRCCRSSAEATACGGAVAPRGPTLQAGACASPREAVPRIRATLRDHCRAAAAAAAYTRAAARRGLTPPARASARLLEVVPPPLASPPRYRGCRPPSWCGGKRLADGAGQRLCLFDGGGPPAPGVATALPWLLPPQLEWRDVTC